MMMNDAPGTHREGEEQAATAARESALSQALSVIVHEIRNPLTSLTLNAQMIARAIERGQAPHSESARLLTQAISQLDQITNELSEAVRAESERFALTLRPVDLVALARRVASDAELLYQRPITLDLPTTPLLARADAARIQVALAHLLANADAYTPPERAITLSVRRAARRSIRIEVRDEGPGIAAHDLPCIFDAFYHGSPRPQRSGHPGADLGLGLYIARAIMQRHGGEIGVESAVGQGATLWCTLPQLIRN